MTNYHLKPPSLLPSLKRATAREKRKQVLAAVRKRRAEIYRKYRLKAREHSWYTNSIYVDQGRSTANTGRYQRGSEG